MEGKNPETELEVIHVVTADQLQSNNALDLIFDDVDHAKTEIEQVGKQTGPSGQAVNNTALTDVLFTRITARLE